MCVCVCVCVLCVCVVCVCVCVCVRVRVRVCVCVHVRVHVCVCVCVCVCVLFTVAEYIQCMSYNFEYWWNGLTEYRNAICDTVQTHTTSLTWKILSQCLQ